MPESSQSESDQNNEELRPRFKIERRRIDAGSSEPVREDFVPDKVIYIEIDDEITMVFDRIKRVRGKRIALVVPKRATLLQSTINLTILKQKIDELDKEIALVSSDMIGLQRAEKVGIATAEKLFDKTEARAPETPPLSRTERPHKVSGKKLSISEVIRQDKPALLTLLVGRIKEYFKHKKQQSKETRIVFVTPNKQALFTLILVSVLLLLAIAYIALPGATIYITPRSSILDPAFNITFLDFSKNRELIESDSLNTIAIPTFPVNPPPLTKKFTHNATGKVFRGTNAEGIITITNESSAPWDLAARTRFQTDEGLVFRIPAAVRVPAATATAAGKLDVRVVADELDVNGQVIGARGNIPPARFFLPGLKNEENRKKLYGVSTAAMTGGVSETVKTVSQEDIEAARGLAKREIAKSAVDDLKKFLGEYNLVERTNLSLLTDSHVIVVNEPTFTLPGDLAGKAQEHFEITATYTVSGIAFDRQRLIDALKTRIASRVDPDKKILKINDDDISYKFLDQDTRAGRVRLTATMRAVQVYELDPDKENGHRFIKKITDHILGLRVDQAEEYLRQQTSEIAHVEITTWPIWAPSIPNIADNVKFVIREENDLQ